MAKAVKLAALIGLVTGAMAVVTPAQADAFFRLGGEARWAPLGSETMEQDGQSVEANRQLESLGVGVRGLFDFKYLGVGAKLGLARHAYDDGEFNYTQFDANVHLRSGMPLTRLNFIVEGGPTLALDIGDVGYNVVAGAEVDVLGWPHVDLNLGLTAQYARVPIGVGPDEIRDNEGLRGMVTLGVDVSLID